MHVGEQSASFTRVHMSDQVHSDNQGPLALGRYTMSGNSTEDGHIKMANMQSEVSFTKAQPRPIDARSSHHRIPQGHPQGYESNNGAQPSTSRSNQSVRHTTPATFIHASNSIGASSGMLPPMQHPHTTSVPAYYGSSQLRTEPTPGLQEHEGPPQDPRMMQIHTYPHMDYRGQQPHFIAAHHNSGLSPLEQQALLEKQEAIMAAAHAYASTAGRYSPPPQHVVGYAHPVVPPPPYYDYNMPNTAFPAHPGPYYYHHLHHHRHYHHYPPHYPAYKPPPLPVLQRQDSSMSTTSQTSATSHSSSLTPIYAPATTLEVRSQQIPDGKSQHPHPLGTGSMQASSEDCPPAEKEVDSPGTGALYHDESDNAEHATKAEEAAAHLHRSDAGGVPPRAGAHRPSAGLRSRKVTRPGTTPYPSIAFSRSTCASSAPPTKSATLASPAPHRTLRSSSGLTPKSAQPAHSSEGSAASPGLEKLQPRASKIAAASKLAAMDRTPSASTTLPPVDNDPLSLSDRPTKKSRGRRPVLTEELNLDNTDAQASNDSEGSYAFVGDGRAMPVTKEQLEFAGTTKTGRPKMIFICQVPGCSKCFRRAEHLRRHLEGIHSDAKPHVCDVAECRRAFARRDNLKQHMKAVHGREEVKQEDRRDASPIAMTAKDIEEMNAAFAGC